MRWLLAFLGLLPLGAWAQPEVLISLSEHHLYVLEDGGVVADYPIGNGKPSTPTPPGLYRITDIRAHPAWTVPASIMKERHAPKQRVVPPGPHNPLGVYFLRLNDSALGIHGTTQPKRLPGAVSHGCVRMRNADVTELVTLVKRGTKVTIQQKGFQTGDVPAGARAHRPASDGEVELAVKPVIEVPAEDRSSFRDTQ